MRAALFDSIGDAVFIHDLAGRLLDVNRAACERLGYTREELLRLSVADIDTPEFAAQVPAGLERVRRDGHVVAESAHVTKAGVVIPVELNARLVELEGTSAVLSVARDISERKCMLRTIQAYQDSLEAMLARRTADLERANAELRAQLEERGRIEGALRASEERFRRVFEHAPIGMAISEMAKDDGHLTQVNQALCATLGYREDELLGRTILDLTHPDDVARTLQFSRQMTAGQEAGFRVDKRLVRKTGETVRGILATAQLPGDRGTAARLGMFVDLSEQLRMRGELERSRDELRALWARLSEVAEAERRRIAAELHDVVGRNLAALGIHLEMLRSLVPPQHAVPVGLRLDDAMRLVAETAERVRDLMEELRPAALEDFGLAAAIRASADRLRALAGVELLEERYGEPAARPPPAVENALFQIVQEAFHNIARHARARRVTIAVDLADDPMCVTIADDGVGFDAGAPRDPATPRGWGLVFMAERARAIGATLRVESAPGRGTHVTLELPSPCR